MLSRNITRFFKNVSLKFALASIFFVILFVCPNAGAISYLGPDPAEFAIGFKEGEQEVNRARYVLVKSDNTGDQSRIEIPIYYSSVSNPGTKSFEVYAISKETSLPAERVQYIEYEEDGSLFNTDKYINVGNFKRDNSTGMWRTTVSFQLRNGVNKNPPISYYHNRIMFWIKPSGSTTNWYIGNATGEIDKNGNLTGYFNTIAKNPASGQGVGHEYSIQFATPCDVASGTIKNITLYDLDSGIDDNEDRLITVSVKDTTTDKVLSTYANERFMGDKMKLNIPITFEKNHRYKLEVANVSPINILQYRLPYDNAAYINGCPAYSLEPTVNASPSVIEAGSRVTAKMSVTNLGPNASGTAEWKLTEKITTSSGGTSLRTAMSGSRIFNDGITNLTDYITIDTDYPGARICYILSVRPRSNADSSWNDSSESCVVIGKAPKVQIWGGDLWTRSNVQTGSSLKNISGTNRMFGSWVEYGIFAGDTISGTASGSAFAGGLENPPTACSYSTLSFANTPPNDSRCTAASDTIGEYATSRSMPDVAASFPTTSSPTFASGNLDGKQGVYKTSGNVIISGSTIAKGQWVVINAPTATVTINGNISYTGETLHSINDIPQVVIIANKIIINNGVTNVDSWLIANSSANPYVQTCTAVARTVGECNAPLIINGPVIATKLYLYRTAGSGSGAASGDPAEVINLRADAYLWAYARAVNGSRVQTVYMTELPPRL